LWWFLVGLLLAGVGGAILAVAQVARPAGWIVVVAAGVSAAALLAAQFVWPSFVARRDAKDARWREWSHAVDAWPWDADESDDFSIAGLLDARWQVVRFNLLRRPTCLELMRWCTIKVDSSINKVGSSALWLVTGGGGIGKTRLAVELAEDLRARDDGWAIGAALRGRESEAVLAARALNRPALVVVDYADTRGDLAAALTQLSSDNGRPPVRILLLARDTGEWWDKLRRSAEGKQAKAALRQAGRTHLKALVYSRHDQQQAFEQAVDAFAFRLGQRTPEVRLGELNPEESLLMIHAAALVAALRVRQRRAVDRVDVSEALWHELLEHEAGYWEKAQARFGLQMLGDSCRRVVACAILVGADNETDAVDLLMRVPDLARADWDYRHRVAEWLNALYPASGDQWIGMLQPHQLAEFLILDELKGDQAFAVATLTDLPESRLARVLTLLGRAGSRDMWAKTRAEEILQERPAIAISAACRVTLTGIDLDAVITDCIADPAVALSADALEQMWTELPDADATRRLSRTVAAAAKRRAAITGTDAEYAARLIDLCRAVLYMGNDTEAAERGKEAVDLLRPLAEANPGANQRLLLRALTTLADARRDAGQPEQAVLDAAEAVDLLRPLAEANPDANLRWLAEALRALAYARQDAGQPEEAVLDAAEAVDLLRPLAEANPGANQRLLLRALTTLAYTRRAAGQPEQAVLEAAEAVRLWRPLAEANPEYNLRRLADALTGLARARQAAGQPEEAVLDAAEAVDLWRPLAEANPDANLQWLAEALLALSSSLVDLGRHRRARDAAHDAVRTLELLVARNRAKIDKSTLAAAYGWLYSFADNARS
jgi:hypothetical protein